MDLISYVKTANAAKLQTEEEDLIGGVVNILDVWLFVGRMPYEVKPAILAKPKKGAANSKKMEEASIVSFVKTSAKIGIKDEMDFATYNPSSSRQLEGVRITQIWSKALVN
jgi:hypothetical protein